MGVIQPLASSAPASSANGCKRKRGLWRDDVTARRFPPPWTVEEQAACFVVRDHNGQALSYVYYESEPGRQTAAKPLTKDEVAFDERCKIHDLLIEGVELALKKRGYPALADMKTKWQRKER